MGLSGFLFSHKGIPAQALRKIFFIKLAAVFAFDFDFDFRTKTAKIL